MANLTNKPRANWKTAALGTVLGATVVGAALLSTALAVHDGPMPFEIDGNVTKDGTLDDWQIVFGLDGVTPPATGTPIATGAEVFIRDLPSSATDNKETQYNAGKDVLDVSAWTRKEVSKVVPDKDNITDAFAKQYLVDHDGNAGTPEHRVIYFGADRFANNGDAALGFWFFQQKVELTGTTGFSPNHTVRNNNTGQRGDILVQVDFVGGGSSSEIQIFEWVGSGGSHGPLHELKFAAANGSVVCTADNVACATTNNRSTGSYWPYTPKFGSSGTFPSESFFEGGIDLTALVGDVCLNSFLANTRTSHSETADLKDLALGDFNTCGSIDLVRKECQAAEGLSPVYDAQTELFQTKHVLTIRNDGLGGNVFDVSVRDDAVGSDTFCNIIGIAGAGATGIPSIPSGGIPIPDNTTYIQVAETLAAGVANQMTVTLLCQAPLNGFSNSASIRAGQTNGGTSLTDSYAESGSDVTPQCVVESAPSLSVTKTCEDVTLDPSNGFKPRVCVDISITNTSHPSQRLDITSFTDTRLDGSTADLLGELPLGTDGHRQLQPGETVNILDSCYTPLAPDSDQTDPDIARYSDTVSAQGQGHIGGTTEVETASATCDLCPVGLDN